MNVLLLIAQAHPDSAEDNEYFEQHLYQPLHKTLAQDQQVRRVDLPPQASSEAVAKALQEAAFDAVIATGLDAAHLPAALAGLTPKPVFGIPLAQQWEGLDALSCMQEMPLGLPVISTAPNRYQEIPLFLKQMDAHVWQKSHALHLVLAPGLADAQYIALEIQGAQKFAQEHNAQLSHGTGPREEALNIVLVHAPEAVREGGKFLHIPLQAPEHRRHAEAGLEVLRWVQHGGLWLGVNHIRNAIAAYLRFCW